VEHPIALAASMNSELLIASILPRIKRANTGICASPIAYIVLISPAPSTVDIAIAKIIAGNDCMTSRTRISKASSLPPKNPVIAPRKMPIVAEIMQDPTPMLNVNRAP
jgi:hypothetical protein